jgi:hypothetical protein
MKAIAANTDLSDGKAVQKTFNTLMSMNPESANAWLKSVKPVIDQHIEQQKLTVNGKGLSNLGEHFRDAMSIKQCAPGDEKCKQEAMDLVMRFKKPETSLTKGLGEGASKALWAGREKAQASQTSLRTINVAQQLLDKGITTGSFSGTRQSIARFFNTMGLTKDPSVDSTDNYLATLGYLVKDILGSGDFGAGTGLSDKDVEFVQTMVGGSTDISAEALRRILDISRRTHKETIKRHNEWSAQFDEEQLRRAGVKGMRFGIKAPEDYQTPGVDPKGEMDYGDFKIK